MAHACRTAIRRFALAGCLLCWSVLGAVSAPADAETAESPLTIYQWTDHNGSYRYTPEYSRVPRYARDSPTCLCSCLSLTIRGARAFSR